MRSDFVPLPPVLPENSAALTQHRPSLDHDRHAVGLAVGGEPPKHTGNAPLKRKLNSEVDRVVRDGDRDDDVLVASGVNCSRQTKGGGRQRKAEQLERGGNENWRAQSGDTCPPLSISDIDASAGKISPLSRRPWISPRRSVLLVVSGDRAKLAICARIISVTFSGNKISRDKQ